MIHRALSAASMVLALLVLLPAGRVEATPQDVPVVTIEGVVASVDFCVSQEFPSLTLSRGDGTTAIIITGPYFFLVENDFLPSVGDRVTTRSFPSLWFDGAYVAIDVTNLTTLRTLRFRTDDGRPLWSARGGPGQAGMGLCPWRGGPTPAVVNVGGIVTATRLGFGLTQPSITLATSSAGALTLLLGPYRYLVENQFVVRAGDLVSARAYEAYAPDGTYVVIDIVNVTAGTSLALRDEDGSPLWIGGGPGGPGGPGPGGGGAGGRMGDVDGWIPPAGPLTIDSLEGVVRSVELSCGGEFPSFVLLTQDAREVTIVTGPYYLLLQSGFDIAVGHRMSVVGYASCWFENAVVAIQLTNLTTGRDLVLRDDDGMPLWSGTGDCGGAGVGFGGGAAFLAASGRTDRTIKGRVVSWNAGWGDGFATMTIRRGDGRTVTVVVGPHRYLLGQEFAVRTRDRLRVVAMPLELFDGVYVAREVRNRTTHRTIALRDEAGRPLWER